jgi:chemotaxis protein histidine kinase CheA
MAKSVQELPTNIKDLVEIREWDMRTLEGNSRFMELRGRALPTIALEGRLAYESIIPGQEELVAEITRLWNIKNN